jgi:hypothetical protein
MAGVIIFICEVEMSGYSRQAWPGMDGSQPIHSMTEAT